MKVWRSWAERFSRCASGAARDQRCIQAVSVSCGCAPPAGVIVGDARPVITFTKPSDPISDPTTPLIGYSNIIMVQYSRSYRNLYFNWLRVLLNGVTP